MTHKLTCREARPRLLDLFCGAGGAAMGYYRAGFDVVGVDSKYQPRYPFKFIQADAMEYLAAHGHEYDAIHASPPCQEYSRAKQLHPDIQYPDLVEPVRKLLVKTGKPYVIENVPGAPLETPMILKGSMFGLKVKRDRLFESNGLMLAPPPYQRAKKIYSVFGKGGGKRDGTAKEWSDAMGIDWMSVRELSQAIPPAYTEHVGRQLLNAVKVTAPERSTPPRHTITLGCRGTAGKVRGIECRWKIRATRQQPEEVGVG